MNRGHAVDEAHLYVLGEVDEVGEATGPVKIGLHYGKPSQIGRAGLTTGNWRELKVRYHHTLPEQTVRWNEFVIHQHLAPMRKRGEWFDVRRLLPAKDAWGEFLDLAYHRCVPGGRAVNLGTPGHQLEVIRMFSWRPPREIAAECSCGHVLHARRTTLPAVYKLFLAGHAAHPE